MYKQEEGTLPLLEQSLSQLPNLVLIAEVSALDPLGPRVIFANEAAERETGFSNEEMIGKSPLGFLTDEKDEAGRHKLQSALQGVEAARIELSLRAKGGRPYWADLRVVPLGRNGKPTHYLITVDNITASKHEQEAKRQLQEQLFQSQKMESIGVLASGIAHDFNNILTGIVGSTELVKMALPQPHPAHEDLDNIVQAAQRAASLTRELLAYASTSKSVHEIINLNEMVTSILVIMRSQMSRSIIVRKALMPDVPNVEADLVQIQQVMMNLCLNASEAMKEQGGILSITTDRVVLDEEECDRCTYLQPTPGTYAVFEVSDTGSGMDAEQLKHIFEPFYTTRPGGRGLGLAVVRSIVTSHRGGIQVTSEPGQGTTVRIFLPATEKRLPQHVKEKTAETGGAQTILFVDDEEILRSLGKRALERFGYQVLLAADGIEAVRVFREHADKIDLVILDLSMPRKGGEDAYQEMRGIRDDLKILLCCGYNEAIANTKIAGENVVGFLPKPFGIDSLAQTVQEALRERK